MENVAIELEKKIVHHLLNTAKDAGWVCNEVNDGGDDLVKCKSITEALDAVFAVEEATLCFSKVIDGKTKVCGVFVVLGNGVDCIADCHVFSTFQTEVMDISDSYVDSLDA
jgi:hypothetical protein